MNMTLCETLSKFANLKEFKYNKSIITHHSIISFNLSAKCLNDKNNKIRENIIGAVINNKVPEDYYIIQKWSYIKQIINKWITQLNQLNIDNKECNAINCLHKAGRNNNHDFDITLFYNDLTQETFKVELKFNAQTIDCAPQFVSPMKPSQYMSNSYEEYFYKNYLPKIAEAANLLMPDEISYLNQIHSNSPKCMKLYQDLYYQGCKQSSKFTNDERAIKFYELCKNMSNESIREFIEFTDLNINMLTEYLFSTQKNKIYMLYYNKAYILQTPNMENYIIESVNKMPSKYRYECITKSGKTLNVLLRWKNGNGIAFPAFQIS